MPEQFSHNTFISPFTWRYGSDEMRQLFSEVGTRTGWREMWCKLAETQAEYELVSQQELADIKSKSGSEYVDLKRAHEIEDEIKHDLMAEVRTYAEQTPIGGGKIHLGATSMDIEDNYDALRMKRATGVILDRLANCLNSTKRVIETYQTYPVIAWTHLQPAGVTTVGYRFATYAQDLITNIENLEFVYSKIKGKGMKGIVGTSSSYKKLLETKATPKEFEERVMKKLGIEAYPVATQTYPRLQDYNVLSTLAGIAVTTNKFATDLRFLMSPVIGEMAEPIGKSQVGSSAAPWKQNPKSSERICALARYSMSLPQIAASNASLSILERTLDDSANRRIIIPEGFLVIDEILNSYRQILDGLVVRQNVIKSNIGRFWPFMATEPLLMGLVKKGANRQEMHEKLRGYAFKAWDEVLESKPNPLKGYWLSDSEIVSRVGADEIERISNPSDDTGDAIEKCDDFLKTYVNPVLARYEGKFGKKADSKF
ncbi:adenylosuccinate lyase [archaeon]|nr:MAG: adenylosuccinate lyase [archaeon]